VFNSDNWVRALFLAYYLTGLNMVLYHSTSAPIDRPGYVYLGFWRKVLSGAIWPYIARLNRELGWFVVTYFASVIVAAMFYALVGLFLDHGFWLTLLVAALCTTPLGAMPLALVSTTLWLALRRPLGLVVPSAMERVQRYRDVGIEFDMPGQVDAPVAKPSKSPPFSFGGTARPSEISALLACIETVRLGVPAQLQSVSDPVLSSLRSTVSSKWKDADITRYVGMAREGHSPESFVCNHLVHAMADELESGWHHVYRGVLSGEGGRYRAVFEHAIRTMVERGEYTNEWADEHLRKATYSSIKSMG